MAATAESSTTGFGAAGAATARSAADLVTPDMVATYRRQGYLKLPALLDGQELADLAELCRATESEPPAGLAGFVDDDGDGTARFAYHADERYQRMWSNSFDLRLRYPEVMDLVARFAVIAEALVGEEVRVFWDKTFVKPPADQGTRQSVWHQDFPYNPIDRRGMLTVWLAIEDVPAESGALRFVPRSHRLGPLGRLDLIGHDHELDELLRDDDRELVGDPVTVPLAAGEATVHDALTLHGAGPNVTDRPRRAWTVVYLPASTLYLGGPHPQEGINDLDLVPFEPFDHPRFVIP